MGEIKALIADRMQEWDTEPLSHLMEVGTKHSTERTLEAWQGIEFSTWNAAAGEALRFLRRLPGGLEMPSYSRSRSGLVSLVWSRTEHYCEVEFSGEGQFNIYLRYPDKHSEFFAELDSATPMVPVVSGLLKKLSDALREKAVTASIAV